MKPTPAEFAAAFPSEPVDWGAVAAPPKGAVQALWVGHSTFLVQMEGLTFMTDPVFSQRCSPVQWAGPKVSGAREAAAASPRHTLAHARPPAARSHPAHPPPRSASCRLPSSPMRQSCPPSTLC